MQVRAQTLAGRMARTLAIGAVVFGMAPAASAVTIDWTLVGNPGNAAHGTTGYGAVGTTYNIGTYEVTNEQYAEFLNAVAAAGQADPYALYNTSMGSGLGGITRSVVGSDYDYDAIASRADMPVNFVSFYDTLRFANWLNNGQGAVSTETGAYTLEGGTPTPSNGATVTRNAGATIVLTSEDEWYKAAYHNAVGLMATDYFDYPGGSASPTVCLIAPGALNTANCNLIVGDLTDVGSYLLADSPHGTFDQGGNVWEFNEGFVGSNRGLRGSSYFNSAGNIAATVRPGGGPATESHDVGFRVAMVPEPGTGLLVMMGMLGLAHWRRPNA